jgi:hypothetical protein
MAAKTFKAPKFTTDMRMWFVQLGYAFEAADITDDNRKFALVASLLESHHVHHDS